MKVLVMGAGVAGVTAAYQLLKDGHEVVVVDRQPEAANETSFANAGLVAPGHSFAWASPKVPKILLRSLWRNDQAFRLKFVPDLAMWRWMAKFLGQCNAEAAKRNTLIKHRLCVYSQAKLEETVAETGVEYDGVSGGLLYLHRSQAALDEAVNNMSILRDDGQEIEVVDRDRIAEIDPALAPTKDNFAGGIYAPTDGSGDARIFTQELAKVCEAKGAVFHYDTPIKSVTAEGDRIVGIETETKGRLTADSYVMALGCYSPFLARPLGHDLPVYPVKGYSLTIPIAGANNPPTIGGVDEQNLVAYARMGDRVRVTATAEFAGFSWTHKPADFRHMMKSIQDLFPDGCDYSQPEYWAGLRPMTPEGTPILGFGRHNNLVYDTGHGHMGWTMSCGTARIVADLVGGKTPELPLDGMRVR